MSPIVSMMLTLATPQVAGEVREFHPLGAVHEAEAGRTVRVSTDRDLDADGMADEGMLTYACRNGKVTTASFAPEPAVAMIPVGRRMPRMPGDTPAPPALTGRYEVGGDPQAADGRLVGIAAPPAWCAAPDTIRLALAGR